MEKPKQVEVPIEAPRPEISHEKGFSQEDFKEMTHDEKIDALSQGAVELDDFLASVQGVSMEAFGEDRVMEKAGMMDTFKIDVHGLEKNKVINWMAGKMGIELNQRKKMSEVANRLVNEEVEDISRNEGDNLIKIKQSLETLDRDFSKGLEAIKSLPDISEDRIAGLESQHQSERESLIADKEAAEEALNSRRDELSIYDERQQELELVIANYKGLQDSVIEHRKSIEGDIRNLKVALRQIGGEHKVTQDIKEEINTRLKEAEERLKEFKDRESSLKTRLDLLKTNKKEVDSLVKRKNNIGKTPKELIEEKKLEAEGKSIQRKESVATEEGPQDKEGEISKEDDPKARIIKSDEEGESTADEGNNEDERVVEDRNKKDEFKIKPIIRLSEEKKGAEIFVARAQDWISELLPNQSWRSKAEAYFIKKEDKEYSPGKELTSREAIESLANFYRNDLDELEPVRRAEEKVRKVIENNKK